MEFKHIINYYFEKLNNFNGLLMNNLSYKIMFIARIHKKNDFVILNPIRSVFTVGNTY